MVVTVYYMGDIFFGPPTTLGDNLTQADEDEWDELMFLHAGQWNPVTQDA